MASSSSQYLQHGYYNTKNFNCNTLLFKYLHVTQKKQTDRHTMEYKELAGCTLDFFFFYVITDCAHVFECERDLPDF